MPDHPSDSNDKTLLRPVDDATVRLTESDTRTRGRGGSGSESQPTFGGECAPVVPAPGPDGTPFGRYRLLSELGHGGMGVVWKAWDNDLQRTVALKQILGANADREQVQRFLREARLAAKLRHPAIVAVHDVGVIDGQHFFTAEYVEGRALSAAMTSPVSQRQAAAWVKEVAEALSAAHEQGVVHRDVKPGNILLDAHDRPHVTDFGLAREVEAASGSGDGGAPLTMSGALLGTPAYMSPEQAGGHTDRVGPASDQFSLGVVLYELIAGRPPFAGERLRELLNAICEGEPERPSARNPRLHRDLETICLKCLEKDPSQRYASCASLAADLGRYLEGEAIEARPLSAIASLARKARRHRAVVFPVLASLLVVAALVAWGSIRHAKDAAERDAASRNAAEAGRRATAAEEALKKGALVSRVLGRWSAIADDLARIEAVWYDTRQSPADRRARTEALWGPVQRFLDDTPADSASQATAQALAGWARCLAGRTDEGKPWMERAAEIDPDIPYGPLMAAFALFSDLIQDVSLPAVRVAANGVCQARAMEEGEKVREKRAQIEAFLARAQAAAVWGKEGSEECRACLDGVRQFEAGDFAIAEEALSRDLASLALRPLHASLRLARGKARYLRSEFAAALEDFRDAARLRPGSGACLYFIATTRFAQAEESRVAGEDPCAAYRESVEGCTEAIRSNAERLSAVTQRGLAHWALGNALLARGGDPAPEYESALADFGQIVASDSHCSLHLVNRALVYLAMGKAQVVRGIDPRPVVAKAIADADAAASDPQPPSEALAIRGEARLVQGDAEVARGIDPHASYEAAIADLGEAMRREPTLADTQDTRGVAWARLGMAEAGMGKDPREMYRKSIEDLDLAIRLCPTYAEALGNRGNTRLTLANAEAERGADARQTYLDAIADMDAALARNPRHSIVLLNRGFARMRLGMAEATKGDDPRPRYEEALVDFDASIKQNPGQAEAHNGRGNVWKALAEARASRGGEVREAYAKALESYHAALSRNPRLWQALANEGGVYDAVDDPAKAVEAYEAAVAIVGDHVPQLAQLLARARAKAGAKPR